MPNLSMLKDPGAESKLFMSRVEAVIAFICVLLLCIVGRLIFLQIIEHKRYATLSLNNQVRLLPITPTRGLIFDRNGILLADNVSAFSLSITPERTPDLTRTLEEIHSFIPISETERDNFLKQLPYKRRSESIPIRARLTEEEVARFSLEKHRFPGVEVVAHLVRHYPYANTLAHVLGYLGPINEQEQEKIDAAYYRGTYYIGKIGLEKSYETILHGQVGYQHVETDARGRTIRVLRRVPSVPGMNLYLSLDSRLQNAAYRALGDLRGAIVAIEPSTGGILALVSNPTFDPNLFTQGIDIETYRALNTCPDRPLFNRAIRGQYPPGSTIKPLIALQGLELGTIAPQARMFDPGWYQLHQGGRLFRDMIYFATQHGHGWVDLEKAIEQSCDTYFFMMAHKMGIRPLFDIFTRFGLGQKTNVDMVGEAPGLVPSSEWKQRVYQQAWHPGDTLNIGIGQGAMLATPLQMAHVTAILANRGRRITPKLVLSTAPQQDNATPTPTPYTEDPRIIFRDEAYWDIVINAMQRVIHTPGGTAYKTYRGVTYQMAGKTGTAQVYSLKQNEKYDAHKVKAHLRDHSWFIAFAPVEHPQIAIAVLIENKTTLSGSHIARLILDDFFSLEQEHPHVSP